MSIWGFWGKYPYTDFQSTNLDYIGKTLDEHTKDIKALKEADIALSEEMANLDDTVRALGDNVGSFSQELNTFSLTLNQHSGDIRNIRNDISGINTRVNNIDQREIILENRVTNVENGISNVSGRVADLEGEMNILHGEQIVQNNRISALEQGGGGGGGGGVTVAVNPLITSGDNIADITVNGVVNHLYAKKYSTVTAEAKTTTGTEIATITVNGATKSIKNGIDPATLGDKVSFTPALTSGTEVGTITINGTDKKIYAPAGGGGGDSGHGDGTSGWTIGAIGTEKIDHTHTVDYCPIKYNTDNGMLIIPGLCAENFHIWGKVVLGFDFVVSSITIPNGYRIRFMMDMVRHPYAGEWAHMGVNVTIEKSLEGEISTNVTRNYWDISGSEGYGASEYPNVIYGIIEPI